MKEKRRFAVKFVTLAILIILMLILPEKSFTAIIQIPLDQPTIQAGIDAALEHDTVLVADGTYTGDGNRDIDFHGKNIVLMSANGPEVTIIDCEGSIEYPHRGFWFHNGEDSTAVVEGFTITGGYGPRDGPWEESVGGAIKCESFSSPLLRDNVIIENSAGTWVDIFEYLPGGSVYLHESEAILLGNSIINNESDGIYCEGANPIITGCTISGNNGGGMVCFSSSLIVMNCLISQNSASNGGGIALNDQCVASFIGCLIINNSVYESWTEYSFIPGKGGGIFIASSAIELESCTIVGNSGINSSIGGGIYLSVSTSAKLTNSILFGNSAGTSGAIYVFPEINSSVSLSCTVLYSNQGGDWIGALADQANINGNFSADPLFCDTANSDFHINSNSPCAPDNNSCGQLIGALDVNCATTDIVSENNILQLPGEYCLTQNYPNPFNPTTVINFALHQATTVKLEIYNILGRKVTTILEKNMEAGYHSVSWDGVNAEGSAVATGVYFYKIDAGDFKKARKMLLLK